MDLDDKKTYEQIRRGKCGFHRLSRGIVSVHGRESVQFLDGLVTNDMKTLADGAAMRAAFPNAQGRLTALVTIKRAGDTFFIETEKATAETLFKSLFRFTFAGDFFAEDLSEKFSYFEIFGPCEDVFHPNVGERYAGALAFERPYGASYFIPADKVEEFSAFIRDENGCLEISDELFNVIRVEAGIPLFGIDIDENTIVPEIGISDAISYTKGCYIGQEIIARIHFRGHVAKQISGLILSTSVDAGSELTTPEGKNAGRVTSVVFSPQLGRPIALALVRYDFLAVGTELLAGDAACTVAALPFI